MSGAEAVTEREADLAKEMADTGSLRIPLVPHLNLQHIRYHGTKQKHLQSHDITQLMSQISET